MNGCANNIGRVYTVGEWLSGCVNFSVPDSTVDHICVTRGVESDLPYTAMVGPNGDIDARLLKADLLMWMVRGPGKVNNTSDQDNGWAHSEGGYTLSEADKRRLLAEANAIYDELEPESVFGRKAIRMRSAGIMPAYRDTDGRPLPRRPI